jgi:hypothetical protein
VLVAAPVLLIVVLGVLVACAAPNVPAASPSAAPTASPSAPATDSAAALFLPLPEGYPTDVEEPGVPTATVAPATSPGAELGVRYPFALGHCGLDSPFDFDGSLWDPVGGLDPAGGAIDSEAELGELINATEGELILSSADEAQFRTAGGSVILLRRHDGPRAYPLCS